jgi:hypothetical protein
MDSGLIAVSPPGWLSLSRCERHKKFSKKCHISTHSDLGSKLLSTALRSRKSTSYGSCDAA